jgi:3-isopropylmalate dehydrogenase
MRAHVAVLPGDGVGVEVTREARACLEAVGTAFGHAFSFEEHPMGGEALDRCGSPFPEPTRAACLQADAVLLGAVGAPRFDANPPETKPETGLLQLREALGAYANLRPAALHPALADASPLKAERIAGVDLLIVRELSSGLYFGQPRGVEGSRAYDTMAYTEAEVERVARVAFDLARLRRRKVTSVDKANVLESSRLWRRVVNRVAQDFPDVALEHAYVDSCAMALITRPATFDVILTENLFGDILSDEASVLTGSLGMLPSASLGGRVDLYEPVHGSAPDIAGKGLANPIGAIASVAMMLRHTFHLEEEALALETAITWVLEEGFGTPDLATQPRQTSTSGLGAAVLERLPQPVFGQR